MAETLNLIASLSAAVSAIIACFTLSSLKKQRETTYKPDIILEKFRFYGYSFIKNDLPNPDEWSEIDKDSDHNFQQSNNFLELKLHNIGLGAAKYVTASFDFDVIEAIKLIKSEMLKIPEEFRVNVIIDQKMLEINPNSNSTPFGKSIFTKLKYDQLINHVLPSNVIKEPSRLTVFPHYLKFISLSIYLMYATSRTADGKKSSIMTLIDLPPLILNLRYFDIANQTHYKKFELTFSMITSTLKKVDGYFNIKELTDLRA